MKSINSVILVLLFFTVTGGCKKSNSEDAVIPAVSVEISLYLNNPSFVDLNAVGGWVYITGGVRGIIVYRKSNTEFMAYDRNCTYQPANPCATVYIDATNIIATDTCCHSQFSIYDGSVLHAPASVPLKTYNTTYDGNVLRIYN